MKKDQETISRSSPKGKFMEKEMGVLEVAVLSYVSLSQANCAKEKTCVDLSELIKSVAEKQLKEGNSKTLTHSGDSCRGILHLIYLLTLSHSLSLGIKYGPHMETLVHGMMARKKLLLTKDLQLKGQM